MGKYYCPRCNRYVLGKRSPFNFRIFLFFILLLFAFHYVSDYPQWILLLALLHPLYHIFLKFRRKCHKCKSKVRKLKEKVIIKKKKNEQ